MQVKANRLTYPAIYKWEEDCVVICLRVEGNRLPLDFKPRHSQQVVNLRCIDPGKER
jgi:hypothetical protein